MYFPRYHLKISFRNSSFLQETTSSGNSSPGKARSTSPTRWPSCTTTASASSAATTASGTPGRPTSPCIATRTGSSSPTRPTWPSSGGSVASRRPARKRHYGLCSKAFKSSLSKHFITEAPTKQIFKPCHITLNTI